MNTTRHSAAEIKEQINNIVREEGLLDTLFNILKTAEEEGYYVESDMDRADDIPANLNLAEEELESMTPDLPEVLDHLEAARTAVSDFKRGLDEELSEFNPNQVDIEESDSLQQHASYIEERIIGVIGMTDEATEYNKEDYQIDIDNVEQNLSDELEEVDIYVAERNMGDGRQFAIEASKKNSSKQLWQSNWYELDEFEAFCSGMNGLQTLLRHAADVQEITSE